MQTVEHLVSFRPASRYRLWREIAWRVRRALLGGAFADLSNEALANHHWAAESALLRAMRTGDVDRVREITSAHAEMGREMRYRRMLS